MTRDVELLRNIAGNQVTMWTLFWRVEEYYFDARDLDERSVMEFREFTMLEMSGADGLCSSGLSDG
jgi:hypothetical protein